MFERWLEKFLRKKVGEFIDGINKTNLKFGLFHGNIVLKKVAIKPKVFQKMGVPGNLKFSWVEKLSINIPWNFFGQQPITIVVEDVYALFESFEQESHVSEFLNEKNLRKRLKFINTLFTKTSKEKSSSHQANKKIKDKNRKILDQIQIVVKNVHFRFEDPWSQCRYAWGLTAKEIHINKVPGSATSHQEHGVLYKSKMHKVDFQDLGAYWLNNIETFLTKSPFYEIKDYMRRFIVDRDFSRGYPPEFVFVFCGHAMVTRDKKISQDGKREVKLNIETHLVPQAVLLERQTVENLFYLQFFYKRWIKRVKKAKAAAEESAPDKENLRFYELFQKIYEYNRIKRSKKHKRFKLIFSDQGIIQEFKRLFLSVSFKDLARAVFQAFTKPKFQRRELSPQEEAFANLHYETVFNQKNDVLVTFNMQEGTFILQNVPPLQRGEHLTLPFRNFTFAIRKTCLEITVQDGILILETSDRKQQIFMQRLETRQFPNVFSLLYERDVSGKEKHFDYTIKFDQVRMFYNIPALQSLINCFKLTMQQRLAMLKHVQHVEDNSGPPPLAKDIKYIKTILMELAPFIVIFPIESTQAFFKFSGLHYFKKRIKTSDKIFKDSHWEISEIKGQYLQRNDPSGRQGIEKQEDLVDISKIQMKQKRYAEFDMERFPNYQYIKDDMSLMVDNIGVYLELDVINDLFKTLNIQSYKQTDAVLVNNRPLNESELAKKKRPSRDKSITIEVKNVFMTLSPYPETIQNSMNEIVLKTSLLTCKIEQERNSQASEYTGDIITATSSPAKDDKKIQLAMKDMEVFVYHSAERISAKNFHKIHKRGIILPFYISLTSEKTLNYDPAIAQYVYHTRNTARIERVILKIHYADISSITENMKYQTNQMKKIMQAHLKNKDKNTHKKKSPFQKSQVKEFFLKTKGAQLVLIDNSQGLLAPALKLNIDQLDTNLEYSPSKIQANASIRLKFSYFNAEPCRWEPILEKSGLEISCEVQEKRNLYVNIKNHEDTPEINFNLSEKFIQILVHLSKSWKIDSQDHHHSNCQKSLIFKGKQDQENFEEHSQDHISPYMIINTTGFPIEIQTAHSKYPEDLLMKTETYFIENKGATQYLLPSEPNHIFEGSIHNKSINRSKINVKILYKGISLIPNTTVNIDKSRVLAYSLHQSASKSPENISLCSIVQEVQCKKIITLTSQIHITNKLTEMCEVILEDGSEKFAQDIKEDETMAIPINFIHTGSFLIKYKNSNYSTKKISIDSFLKENNSSSLSCQIDSSYLVLACQRPQPDIPFLNIFISPPLQIKNCCLVDFQYQLFEAENSHNKGRFEGLIKAQEAWKDLKINPDSNLFIQIKLEGFDWSEKLRLPLEKNQEDLSREIYLKNETSSLKVMLMIPKGNNMSRKVLIYTEAYLINETPFELEFKQFSEKIKEDKIKELQDFSGFSDLPMKTNSPQGIACNDIQNMVLRSQNFRSRLFAANIPGSQSLELLNKETVLELGVNTGFVECEKAHGITAKIITISPRYILVNNTAFDIEIGQQSGLVSMVVKSHQRAPLEQLYYSNSKNKKKVIKFRINNEWLWSQNITINKRGVHRCSIVTHDRGHKKTFQATLNLRQHIMFITISDEEVCQLLLKKEKARKKKISKIFHHLQLNVNIATLGVSIISPLSVLDNKERERREIMYFFLRGIDFSLVDDMQTRTFEFKLRYLNIDNNAFYSTLFPVVLTPADPFALSNHPKVYFIDATIKQKLKTKHMTLEEVNIKIADSLLKIDHLLRNSFLETLHNIAGVFSGDPPKKIRQMIHTHLSALKNKKEDKIGLPQKWSWYDLDMKNCLGPIIHLKRLLIQPFRLTISSQLALNQTEDDIYNLLDLTLSCKQKTGPQTSSTLINLLIKMTGKSSDSDDFVLLRSAARIIAPFVSDLDGFTLSLKRVSIQQFFDYPFVLMKLMANIYVTETTKILMGMFELFKRQKLAKMFENPNFSQTLVETEYQVQKVKAQTKRQHFVKRFMNKLLTKSSSILNIHKKPLKGDVDEYPEFMNESTTRTIINASEGIFKARRLSSDTSLKVLDEKANYHRIRLPRAFHGKEKFYRDYAHSDAEALWVLNFAEAGRYKDLSLIKSFDGFYEDNNFYMLIVAFERIIWWSFKEDAVKWAFEAKNIEKLDYVDNEVQVELKQQQQHAQKNSTVTKINLKSKDALQNVLLYEELVTLMVHCKINDVHY